jgi:mRNA-degrading endonuclease RelE of RelBE toxin-antitoxin system
MKFIKKLKELVKKDLEPIDDVLDTEAYDIEQLEKDKKKETWEEKIERLKKKDPFIYK